MADFYSVQKAEEMAKKLIRMNDVLLATGNDWADVLLDAANMLRTLPKHVEGQATEAAALKIEQQPYAKWQGLGVDPRHARLTVIESARILRGGSEWE